MSGRPTWGAIVSLQVTWDLLRAQGEDEAAREAIALTFTVKRLERQGTDQHF